MFPGSVLSWLAVWFLRTLETCDEGLLQNRPATNWACVGSSSLVLGYELFYLLINVWHQQKGK